MPIKKSYLLTLIFVFILLFILLFGFIGNLLRDKRLIKSINNKSKIIKIEYDFVYGSDPNNIKKDSISDSKILSKINQFLPLFEEVKPDRPQIHTQYTNLYIYRTNEKVNISLANTTYSGWLFAIGSSWYKNDSLFNLIKQYLN